MHYKTQVKGKFKCSLERAFKTPMLCDVTKVHSGFLFMPRVTHCTEDENWGKTGGSRKVFMEKNIFFKGGEAALDTVLIRKENKYWKIEISDFKMPFIGIEKLQGEWEVQENEKGTVQVIYTYHLFSKHSWMYLFHWYFTKTIWKMYMKHAMENIREMAYINEPYLQQ